MAKMDQDSLKNNLSNMARAYLWEVVIPNVIGGGDNNALELRCQTTSLPGRGVGNIHVPFKGTAGIEFPGKITLSHQWACTFIEGTDAKVFNALHQWQEAIGGVRSGIGSPDTDIKSDIYLNLLDQAGDTWKSIKVVGCFPQNIDNVPLPYEGENAILFNTQFRYDHWEPVE